MTGQISRISTGRRRLAYLWFPFLAAETLIRHKVQQDPEVVNKPFVLTCLNRGTERLVSLNGVAEKEGLAAGQSLADARTLAPGLESHPADPRQTGRFLVALARWSERFSPLVGIDGSHVPPDKGGIERDALVIDIVGVAHLFGGEQAMLQGLMTRFNRFGLTTRGCITDNKAAARALCIYREAPGIIAPGKIFDAVKNISVQALEPSAAASRQLAHLGLVSLEQIANMPRAGLARRFGMDLVKRLGCLLGQEPAPIQPLTMKRPWSVRLRFPEPLGLQSDINAAAERILVHLLQRLETAGYGLRELCLTLTAPNSQSQTCGLGFAVPCTDIATVMRLLEPKTEVMESEFGFDEIRAEAVKTGSLEPRQASLVDDRGQQGDQDLSQLFNLLGNRIGFGRICRFERRETHLPEQRFVLAPVTDSVTAAGTSAKPVICSRASSLRPLSCFPRPEPLGRAPRLVCHRPPDEFLWRRRLRQVRQAIGPERIAPPWWQACDGWDKGPRDYWQVQTNEGDWLWLFTLPRQRDPACWFVSGRFD